MDLAGPYVVALDPDECRRLLATVTVGRIGICVGALPAIRTVRFQVAGGRVVFRARHGSRLREGAAGQIVAFHADHFDESARRGWAVEALGRCLQVPAGPLADRADRSLAELWPNGSPQDSLLCLDLDQLSGQQVRWPERVDVGDPRSR